MSKTTNKFAMITFIDDHRDAYGSSRSAAFFRLPVDVFRTCRAATGSNAATGASAVKSGSQARDRARVRRELRGLRRAQGVAADDVEGFPSPAVRSRD